MIDYAPSRAIDSIEGTDGVLSLTAVYRHFAPDDDRYDLHTLRFRYTTNRKEEYLLGLDEWCPPDRPVSAQQLGMLTYLEAYFASYDIHVSMAVPIFEPGDRADDVSPRAVFERRRAPASLIGITCTDDAA